MNSLLVKPVIPKPAKGICSTVLLILIIVLATTSIPSATSQQFTTSTNFLTATQTETSTQYSQSVYAVNSTSVGTMFTTAYLTKTFDLPVTNPLCTGAELPFNSTGTEIHLHFKASQKVAAFILNRDDLQERSDWEARHMWYPCHGLAFVFTFKSYIAESGDYPYLNLPVNGNPYLLLFLTFPDVRFSSAVNVTMGPVSILSSSTSTSTVSVQLTLTNIDTLTTMTTMEISFTEANGNWLVAAALIVVIVIAVLLFALRRRNSALSKTGHR